MEKLNFMKIGPIEGGIATKADGSSTMPEAGPAIVTARMPIKESPAPYKPGALTSIKNLQWQE